jgi:hypothetical protein
LSDDKYRNKKGKAVSVLKLYAMKAYAGVGVKLYVFLISAIDGGDRSGSRFGLLAPREENTVPIG